MVTDHSDSERGNPLPPQQGFFYMFPSHRQDSTYHGLCYTKHDSFIHSFVAPVVEHWLEREIAQWVHP